MNPLIRTVGLRSAAIALTAVACSDSTTTPPPNLDGPLDLRTAWGEPGDGPGQFRLANDVAVARDGTVYVVDSFNNRVQVFTSDGGFLRAWDVPDADGTGPLSARRVEVGRDGRVYVVNGSILIYSHEGRLLAEWPPAADDSNFQDPADIAVDANGRVYVASRDFVYKLDGDGRVLLRWGGRGDDDGQFEALVTLETLDDGTLAAADHRPNRVQHFTPEGAFLRSWSLRAGTHAVRDLARAPGGDIYAMMIRSGNVDRFSASGEFEFGLDANAEDPILLKPNGIAVDAYGNLYVASSNRVQKFGPSR
jgi:DNA-binding beta-propeller fold protein YncE